MFDVKIGPDIPAIISFIGWPDYETQQAAARRTIPGAEAHGGCRQHGGPPVAFPVKNQPRHALVVLPPVCLPV